MIGGLGGSERDGWEAAYEQGTSFDERGGLISRKFCTDKFIF